MPRIDPTVSVKAKEIYMSMAQGERGKFVSDAIIEKWAKEHGEVFTAEQVEFIRKEIASFLSGK